MNAYHPFQPCSKPPPTTALSAGLQVPLRGECGPHKSSLLRNQFPSGLPFDPQSPSLRVQCIPWPSDSIHFQSRTGRRNLRSVRLRRAESARGVRSQPHTAGIFGSLLGMVFLSFRSVRYLAVLAIHLSVPTRPPQHYLRASRGSVQYSSHVWPKLFRPVKEGELRCEAGGSCQRFDIETKAAMPRDFAPRYTAQHGRLGVPVTLAPGSSPVLSK